MNVDDWIAVPNAHYYIGQAKGDAEYKCYAKLGNQIFMMFNPEILERNLHKTIHR